jgi:cyclase
MRRVLVLGVLLGIGGLVTLRAQPAPRASIAAIQNVKDNLYVIMKSDPTDRSMFTGGNTAVFVTDRGVILVDTKLPGYGQDILTQVRSVTDKPVVTIINTHTHNDHSGSNVEFPASIEYVAHDNTRANMSKDTCPPVTNCQSFKGDNAKYLPKRTFKDMLTIGTGKDQVDLYYFGRGHTNGDSWVVFPALRTMHTGDMFQRKNMPFIDVADNGGSAVEWADTQRKALAGIKNVTTVIPGHANVLMTWDDFAEGVAFYRDFLDTVQGAIKAGKTVDATVAAYAPPEKYKHFQVDPARAKANIEAIYKELSSGR